jgi:hypothetical protein
MDLGYIYNYECDYKKAIYYFKHSLKKMMYHGPFNYMSNIYFEIANIYKILGNDDEAITNYENCYENIEFSYYENNP